MKMHYYTKESNFGDAINPWFWEYWVGDLFENQSDSLFVGIGTLINNRIPESFRSVHIMGSGAGYGDFVPTVKNNWIIHCVRGPLTAKTLGIDLSFAIADPAILINEMVPVGVGRKNQCGFMPHIGIDSPRFKDVIESMGLVYISPKSEREIVIREVNSCERLICSAMHGAILAEALRIPWFPVSTSKDILGFKWYDWMLSMEIESNLTPITSIWSYKSPGVIGTLKAEIRTAAFKAQLKRIMARGRFLLAENSIFEQRKEQLKSVIINFNESNKRATAFG